MQLLLWSQVSSRSGAISGIVSDPQGAPVQGAKIRATSVDTNQGRETETNERGEFLLANLNAGPYSAKVEAAGFAGKEYSELLVGAGQSLFQKVELRLSSVAERLEVVDDAPV
ncbi:MAG: carboxypeptidase-like regulatory domain-containing protein, partial [Acidobacteria bacterium]|nr:carboxypeptidase-like regulatory domain-containing protein [Acidobacteriota bacterium]